MSEVLVVGDAAGEQGMAKEVLDRVVSGAYPKGEIQQPTPEPKPELTGYKKLQAELRRKCNLVWAARPENNQPGKIITSMSGQKYEVQKDGSWRKV